MRNVTLKVVVVLVTVLSSWAITKSIMAQFTLQKPANQSVVAASASKKEVTNDQAKTAKDLQIPYKSNSQTLKRFSAKAQGNTLNVEAEVQINDLRKDRWYVWTLYVLNFSDESAQFVHVHDTQVFTIPDSGQLSPTFQETTKLPSGTYKVIVTLTRLPMNADLSFLKDPKSLNSSLAIRGYEKVQID